MPLLPAKNTLDFNPNSTILASKKIANIALERMKNPVLDPDQNTLTTLQAEKNIEDSFNKLDELAGNFNSLILRIKLVSKTQIGSGRKRGGKRNDTTNARKDFKRPDRDTTQARKDLEEIVKKISEDVQSVYTDETGSSASISVSEYLRRLRDDASRYSDTVKSSDYNSSATPLYDGEEIDDDAVSALSFPSRHSVYYDEDHPEEFYNQDKEMSSLGENINLDDRSWTSLIFQLIQVTRRMNIIVTSRIRPVINTLTDNQVRRLTEVYSMVYQSYNDLIAPFLKKQRKFKEKANEKNPFLVGNLENIVAENEYGDEVLNVFNSERQKLLLNLSVIINSWKQNSATGQQVEFDETLQRDFDNTTKNNKDLLLNKMGGSRRKMSGGRNLHGNKISNAREIPTLLSAIRDCPTKRYL